MKQYLNPEKFIIEIQDISDEMHRLEAVQNTPETLKKIQQLGAERVSQKNENFSVSLINRQLSIVFQKPEEFFNKFDLRLLTAVMRDYSEHVKKKYPGAAGMKSKTSLN